MAAYEDEKDLTPEARESIKQLKTFYNYLLVADAGVNLVSSMRKAASIEAKQANSWKNLKIGSVQAGRIAFRVGDEIAGIPIVRVKQGTNGKYIVIGRNMDGRVIPVAKESSAEYWTGFNSSLSEVENLANNRLWIKSKLSEGYNVIDVGLDPEFVLKGDLSTGSYYGMELLEVFGIK